MPNFDEQPIKGLNIKLLVQGVLIVASTVSCYFGIVSKIDTMAIETKYKMEALQVQINNNRTSFIEGNAALQIQINDLKHELADKQDKKK